MSEDTSAEALNKIVSLMLDSPRFDPDLIVILNDIVAERDALKARVDELEGALQFYANSENWADGAFANNEPGFLDLILSSAHDDKGAIAGAALKGDAS